MRHQGAWNIFATGLTGVMLTLLSIFLVPGPFCRLGVPWKPYVAMGNIVVASEPNDLVVTINRDGVVFTPAGAIETALASKQYTRIVMNADRHAEYGALEPILRAARTHNLPVVFAGEPRSVLEQAAAAR